MWITSSRHPTLDPGSCPTRKGQFSNRTDIGHNDPLDILQIGVESLFAGRGEGEGAYNPHLGRNV
jgi:hypothetical protein